MNETAIRLEAISKCYFTTPVFQHLSAAFPKGRIIGLLGENRSRKDDSAEAYGRTFKAG